METYPSGPPASYVFTGAIQFKTLISAFENGVEQRRKKWGQGKPSFSLIYDVLTSSEMDILYDFYVARSGSYEAFYFVNPVDSQTYTVRFVDDELSYDMFSVALYKTGLKLVGVF